MNLRELIDHLIQLHYTHGSEAEVYIHVGNTDRCVRRIEVGRNDEDGDADVVIYPT